MNVISNLQGLTLVFSMLLCVSVLSQELDDNNVPDFTGTWSDPPARAEDAFCHIGCMVEARDYLTSLLDDPANVDRTYAEIKEQAKRFQISQLMPGLMTPDALEQRKNRSRPPASAVCKPWGMVRTALAPHAMEFNQHDDHITLYYSEWTARRTIYLDAREVPADLEPSNLGYSVGHYDGDDLVVETTGILANNFAEGGFVHSDQVSISERFTRIGERLEVEVVLTDPLTYIKPLRMARAWAWAPGEEIYPYDNCIIPTE